MKISLSCTDVALETHRQPGDLAWQTEHPVSILVTRVNHRPTGRFLAILSAKFPLNMCSRLHSFEPKHTMSMLCTCESSHMVFTWRRYWVVRYHMNHTCNVFIHYDSSKRCVRPLYTFVYVFKVVKPFETPCICQLE
jgi:hypothetical protein